MSAATCSDCSRLVRTWRPPRAQQFTFPDMFVRHLNPRTGLRCLGSGRAVPLVAKPPGETA